MPYTIVKHHDYCYSVVNVYTKRNFSTCSTLSNAKKQLRILERIELEKR
jgi:hypothetical protein